MAKLSEEERRLACELRSFCDNYGIEKEEKLHDSGQVLFKMGKLYLEKADECQEAMWQKLTYIRASALLSGAKFRFEKTKSFKKVAEVEGDITTLHKSLLTSAGCSKCKGELLDETVFELKRKLKGLREMVKLEVQEIPVINEVVQAKEKQRKLEREKIEKVRALNELNTRHYKELMTFVSDRITEILGKPPCEFAIAGLGSLARKEITLYSDFEHVILLEGCFESFSEERQLNIREYFRWFAVIFQVVITGLGETFIRSVGVKSINDLSCGDKSRNWFFDFYTPCGMAFDGMVPHSCNTPLGRQEPTEMKKHAVELIQSAGKIAGFLKEEEALKNGYYLDDVLKSTCLVYGSDEVYGSFCKTRDEILDLQNTASIRKREQERITNNCNDCIGAYYVYENRLRPYDVKSRLYRPVTVFVSYFGRIHNIREASSLEIVSSLRRKGEWDDDFCHDVEHALAVACEARLKSYTEAEQERSKATMEYWRGKVGSQSIAVCTSIIQVLKGLYSLSNSAGSLPQFYSATMHAQALFNVALIENAAQEGANILEAIKKKHTRMSLVMSNDLSAFLRCADIVQRSYQILASKSEIERKELYINKSVQLCHEILSYPTSDYTERLGCYQTLVSVNTLGGKYEEALNFLKLWFSSYEEMEKGGKKSSVAKFQAYDKSSYEKSMCVTKYSMHLLDIDIRVKHMDSNELLQYLEQKLKLEKEVASRLLLRCYIAIVRIAMGDETFGRKELLSLSTEIASKIISTEIAVTFTLLQLIAHEQVKNWWSYDSSVTIIELYEVMKNAIQWQSGFLHFSDEQRRGINGAYAMLRCWREDECLPLDNKN